MSHRSYPNAERALRQLDRHIVLSPTREPSEFELRLARQATAALHGASVALRPYYEAMQRTPAMPR